MGDNQTDSRVDDTICALASAPGRGGIGIIKVSGSLAKAISSKILKQTLATRKATLLSFHDAKGKALDKGIALFFKKPNSFTGEDVLELQAHGGPVLLDLLIREILKLGARPAKPGEFSERAFLNGKIDLTQAEAIADIIDAASEQAVRLASKSLQGEFSKQIQKLVKKLTDLRIFVEAAIDFPEEEIDFIENSDINERLLSLLKKLDVLEDKAKIGNLLQEGMTVVIAGQPNAGKSSLLNCLAGRNTAIVTDIPGTTRDILKEYIQIDGLPLHILDTAGLRETDNKIEQEGVRRAWCEIEKADGLLLVVDDNKGLTVADEKIIAKIKKKVPIIILLNKADQTGRKIGLSEVNNIPAIRISAKDGSGIDLLNTKLKKIMGYTNIGEGVFMARRRHLESLAKAKEHLLAGQKQIKKFKAGELLAEDLRLAQNALSQITGEFKADDLLGKIFSNFCIGK